LQEVYEEDIAFHIIERTYLIDNINPMNLNNEKEMEDIPHKDYPKYDSHHFVAINSTKKEEIYKV